MIEMNDPRLFGTLNRAGYEAACQAEGLTPWTEAQIERREYVIRFGDVTERTHTPAQVREITLVRKYHNYLTWYKVFHPTLPQGTGTPENPICSKCGQAGQMFTTLAGGDVCDDCI